MKIWFDITNTPHVHFFYPMIRHLGQKHEIIVTAREFSETISMLKSKGINPLIIGEHKGKSIVNKILGMLFRIYHINKQLPAFDFSISIGGQFGSVVSWLRKKPSIIFTDNDISYKYHAYKLGTYFIFPSYFDTSKVEKIKKSRDGIFQYNGFKEQVYIADYIPDPSFPKQLPFDDYILIRPENLKASYVPRTATTIVPELFKKFKDKNILYLPRYPEEREYAKGFSSIYIPENPVSGLDACYYSKAVLTGAGTFAREAAMLGVPSVSFFPRENLLTVDSILVKRGHILHSRDVTKICEYLALAERHLEATQDNMRVKNEVLSIIDGLITRYRK